MGGIENDMRTSHPALWAVLPAVLLAGCTHIRIHDLDTSAPEQTVALKNSDVSSWLASYDEALVEPIKFCNVNVPDADTICDEPTPVSSGRVVFSFIHLSDVQLYDERVVLVSRAIADLFDRFVASARLDPGQAKHDTAVFLALVESINRWNEGLCRARGGASPYNPMFVVHTGDEIHADVYQEMWEFLQVSSRLRLPWFPLIGNHDVMTFGARPAAEETVTQIETDRPSLAMNIIRTPQEFMAFHGTGEPARLPPGIEMALPPYVPVAPGCSVRTRGAGDAPAVGNPFAEYEIPSTRAPTGAACAEWSGYQARLTDSDGFPGYHSWTVDSAQSRIPESWREKTLGKNIRLRFLFLNTAQDITFSSGGVKDDQLAWARCQLERAGQNNEYVIAFGHHPLSSLFSEREGIGFRRSEYSEIAQEMIDTLAEYRRFLGYFTGHTHRYEHHEVCATSGRCFDEIQAPSAVQEVPQAGLLVRIVEPLTEDSNVVLEVHPFLGPYVESGYRELRCEDDNPDLGGELPDLATAARLGSMGALRHLGCRKAARYREELEKLGTLILETDVAAPMTQ